VSGDSVGRLDEQRGQAVRDLIARSGEVGGRPGDCVPVSSSWWRELLTRIRSGVQPAGLATAMPWRDKVSTERAGWRTRAAILDGEAEPVTEVDYQICSICRLG
jgi:hypothetical protein